MGCPKLHIEPIPNLRVIHRKKGQKPQKMVLDYSLFGMQHEGYNNNVSANVNGSASKFKTFQGQKLEDELDLNWYSFKYRNHDPAIGRFFNIDPLAEDYPYNSTYAFSENKVVMYNELEGLETGPAWWMVHTPSGRQAGVTPTSWQKLHNVESEDEISMQADFLPGIGDAKGFVETFTGNDLVTGEKLSIGQRALGLFLLSELRAIGKVSDVLRGGKWIKTNEHMSEAAASYQKQISGMDASEGFKLNDVKFDGLTKDGTLLDAKSGMQNFVDDAGNFKSFFGGKDGIISQANRQIDAAQGTKIEWHFENENVMNAYRKLFEKEGIQGIDLIHTARE